MGEQNDQKWPSAGVSYAGALLMFFGVLAFVVRAATAQDGVDEVVAGAVVGGPLFVAGAVLAGCGAVVEQLRRTP